MSRIIKKNLIFFIPFFILWGILTFVLLTNSKVVIHLYINGFHSPFFDCFFRISTYIGDGLMPVFIALVLLFISFRKAFIVGVGAIVSGVLAQFFKHVIFSDVLRPKFYFRGIAELYYVPNVTVHTNFSFPSGHTTTAFCLFLAIAYLTKNNWIKFLCLFLALVAGYSRMYLSQHFLIDVYFGALLGVFSAFISILFFENAQKAWLDKSLISIFK